MRRTRAPRACRCWLTKSMRLGPPTTKWCASLRRPPERRHRWYEGPSEGLDLVPEFARARCHAPLPAHPRAWPFFKNVSRFPPSQPCGATLQVYRDGADVHIEFDELSTAHRAWAVLGPKGLVVDRRVVRVVGHQIRRATGPAAPRHANHAIGCGRRGIGTCARACVCACACANQTANLDAGAGAIGRSSDSDTSVRSTEAGDCEGSARLGAVGPDRACDGGRSWWSLRRIPCRRRCACCYVTCGMW